MSEAVGRSSESVQATVEKLGVMRRKLSITVPQSVIQEARSQKLEELRRQVTLPGFRPGRAPLPLVTRMFANEIDDELKGEVIQKAISQAVKDNDLNVLGEPELPDEDISLPKEGALEFEIVVDVAPEFELKPEQYKGLKIVTEDVAVKTDDVNAALSRLQAQEAQRVRVDDEQVQDYDYILGKAQILIGDEIIQEKNDVQTPSSVFTSIVGVDAPGFRGIVVGGKVGETRDIPAKLTDEFEKEEHRGADCVLRLTIEGIERMVSPELNDEFAKKLGFESMEQVRNVLWAQLQREKMNVARRKMQDRIMEELVSRVEMELDDDIIERETQRALDDFRARLVSRGIAEEEADKQVEEFRSQTRDRMVKRLKYDLILESIASQEDLTPTLDEIMETLGEIARTQNTSARALFRQLQKEGRLVSFIADMRRGKAEKFIIDNAEIEVAEEGVPLLGEEATSTTDAEEKDESNALEMP